MNKKGRNKKTWETENGSSWSGLVVEVDQQWWPLEICAVCSAQPYVSRKRVESEVTRFSHDTKLLQVFKMRTAREELQNLGNWTVK